MAKQSRSSELIDRIEELFESGPVAGLGDEALLAMFGEGPTHRSNAAFSALVDRHGPMVLRICRAHLRDPNDADDAFQATFVVLARRAGSLRVTGSIAPWLHGVACRVSAGSRASDRRRAGLVAGLAATIRPETRIRDDLGPALHEEIDHLPPRFRDAVVLCHLEGLTHEEAADRLGCPIGTVRSRLARGRDRLRKALARRGFAPARFRDETTSILVPPSLVLAATRAAGQVAKSSVVVRRLIHPIGGVLTMLSRYPIRSLILAALATGGIAYGLKVSDGSDGQAGSPPASGTQPIDPARFAAMETRLKELEARFATIDRIRPVPTPKPVEVEDLRKIRPMVNDALIGQVFVVAGQQVKKGEPLVEIRSLELARAKHAYQAAFVAWDHDRKFLDARSPLAKEGRITKLVWLETQSDEKKSRLEFLLNGQKLADIGLSDGEMSKLLENFGDDVKPDFARTAGEIRDLSTLTIAAPINGIIKEVGANWGSYATAKDILIVIESARP